MMGLEQFVDEREPSDRTLVVLDGGGPEIIRQSLGRLFENQSVRVRDAVPETKQEEDTVVLVEDGEVIESTPLEAVYNAVLGVNTDLYTTGSRKLEEAALPAVLEGLEGVLFELQDYPASEREKLLLVAISRAIERRAYLGKEGKVRSSFQRLSRINDERGTRSVYERLSEEGLDVHLYGQPDWTPGPEFDVTIHGGYTEDFVSSWFVVYDPPEGVGDPGALVAFRKDRSTWRGFWTFHPADVTRIARYVEAEL